MANTRLEEVNSQLSLFEKQLVRRFSWGEITNWRYSHFKELSVLIEEKTSIKISYLTLTRILQEKQFKRSPQEATLNALAQFLDFQDWDHFCESHTLGTGNSIPPKTFIQEPEALPPEPETGKRKIPIRLLGSTIVAISLIILTVGWIMKGPTHESAIILIAEDISEFPSTVRITASTPASGYSYAFRPLSTSSLNGGEEFRKPKNPPTPLPSGDTVLLVHPKLPMGSFEAVLFYGEEIVSRDSGLSVTNGWRGFLQSDSRERKRKSSVPSMFIPEEDTTDLLTIPANVQDQVGASWIDKLFWSNYFLGENFEIDANNCIVKFQVRQISHSGWQDNPLIRMTLLTNHGLVEIPFLGPIINSPPKFWISDKTFPESDPRLEYLSVSDPFEWQDIQISIHNREVTVEINGEQRATFPYEKPLGTLDCIRIKFRGLGEIKKPEITSWSQENS